MKHYKKFEQTEFELKTTTAINMFDKVTSSLRVPGITFSSTGETTTITLKWNKEGPPTLNDIHLEVHKHKYTVSFLIYEATKSHQR